MKVLALDDDQDMLLTISMVLEDHVEEVIISNNPAMVYDLLQSHDIGALILDMNFRVGYSQGEEGMTLLKNILDQDPTLSIIVLTAYGSLDQAVQAVKRGAFDFLEKPFQNEKLIATIESALRACASQRALKSQSKSRASLIDHYNKSYYGMIGKSAAMAALFDTVEKVAVTDASVLILGEHGTGKEMLGRAIHQRSNRASQPFIQVDLAAIQQNLFESTLFGHKKGAFTDAHEDKTGLIELANYGTLFLDHVDELPLAIQAKLLTVLQSKSVTAIGDHMPRPVDIRVIAAAHSGLMELVDSGGFREDLFYRINTITVEVPPLKARKKDIILLANHYLDIFNRKYKANLALTKEDYDKLEAYHWPGNVRELIHLLERAVILGQLPTATLLQLSKSEDRTDSLVETEKEQIATILKSEAGNISQAAKKLGIGRNTLYRKMRKYGL